MQLCRIATQFSLRTPECTDIITRAYSLRWIEKGFSTYDVTSDQAGSKAAAEDSIPTSLLSPSQAEYDGLPTIPASEFGQSFSSDHSMSSQRVQSLRHPRSIEFYHRRHREVKKFEKKQSRIHNLREIAREKAASGHSRLAQAAATEADRLESPWLSSNTPVKPPSYACVSQGQATALKHVVYASIRAPTEPNLDLKKETKKLDVLNLKVGYAVDAQYALPDEVKAFVLDQTTFCLYGIDKNQVTQIAANIRRIRPPEPYKGAGIRIVGESIKLKERKVK